jgi:hypothetical protein
VRTQTTQLKSKNDSGSSARISTRSNTAAFRADGMWEWVCVAGGMALGGGMRPNSRGGMAPPGTGYGGPPPSTGMRGGVRTRPAG